MARRYVNPRDLLPDSPAALGEWLASLDSAGLQQIYGFGAGSESYQDEFHRAYVAAAAKRDGGQIDAQLRDQAGDLGPLLRSLRPRSSALEALYRSDAPAAGGTAPFGSLADFVREVARHPRDQVVRSEKLRQLQNSFGTNVPSDGGFLVPEQWRADIVLTSLESSIVRPRALVLPMGSQQLHIPSADDVSHATTLLGGMSFTWGDEGALAAESSGKYLDVALGASKLSGYATATNELVNDSAFEPWVRHAWPQAAGWAEDDRFIAGTGVGEPLGLINAPCAISVTRGTSSKVLQADVIGMLTRLLPQSFPRCVWFASTDVLAQLLGDYLLVGTVPTAAAVAPTGWLTGDEVTGWRLLGRPLFITEHSPALGTAGDLTLADPSYYLIGDRLTMQLSASEHPQWNADKTVFKLVSRLDGRMWVSSPVTPKNGANTVSPVIKLV